jgi:hypothetical protein
MQPLTPKMIETLENADLDGVLPAGPTRAALMRRGLVVCGNGSEWFGLLTAPGRELAEKLQETKRRREQHREERKAYEHKVAEKLPSRGEQTPMPSREQLRELDSAQLRALGDLLDEVVAEKLNAPQAEIPGSIQATSDRYYLTGPGADVLKQQRELSNPGAARLQETFDTIVRGLAEAGRQSAQRLAEALAERTPVIRLRQVTAELVELVSWETIRVPGRPPMRIVAMRTDVFEKKDLVLLEWDREPCWWGPVVDRDAVGISMENGAEIMVDGQRYRLRMDDLRGPILTVVR